MAKVGYVLVLERNCSLGYRSLITSQIEGELVFNADEVNHRRGTSECEEDSSS